MTLAAGALFCPSCASPLAPGMAVCARCGHAVHPASALRVARRRPPLVTVLAVLQSLGAVVYLGAAAAMASAFAAIPEGRRLADLAVPIAAVLIIGGFGILHLTSARGLWRLKGYGRTLLRFFAILGLLAFPFGTIIAVAVLVYVNMPGVRLLFSERPMDDLTAEQYADVLATMRSPASRAAVIVVSLFVGATAVTGVVALITIPKVLRAQIGTNEASALTTLRIFVAAETQYSLETGGYFGTPECLVRPADCVRGYQGTSLLTRPGTPVFEERGYRFQFMAGPAINPLVASSKGFSTTTIERFALLAVPVRAGTTGRRMFCVDATYRVRWAIGEPPSVHAATCPADWPVLPSVAKGERSAAADPAF